MAAKTKCIVYGLHHTGEPNRIRYIGQTQDDLKTRLSNHKRKSKIENRPVNKWIRDALNSGHRIKIKVLKEDAVLNFTEEKMIKKYREKFDLLNVSDGYGKTGLHWKASKETKTKMRKAHLGKKLSPNHVEKIRLGTTGVKKSDEHKRKMAERMRGKQPTGGIQKGDTHTQEARKKISLTHLGKKKSEEHKKKIAEAARLRWARMRGEV